MHFKKILTHYIRNHEAIGPLLALHFALALREQQKKAGERGPRRERSEVAWLPPHALSLPKKLIFLVIRGGPSRPAPVC